MISQEARHYLQENLPVDRDNLPCAQNIVAHRAQILAGCQPGIDAILKEFRPQLKHVERGGVDCLDVCPAGGATNDAILLYLYGGGFVTGSPEEDLPIVVVLAQLLGVHAICPRYRLAPEHACPAAIEDSMAVYTALSEQSDSRQLLVCGESAGGNLAMQLVLRGAVAGLSPPHALALLSPWVDLSNGGDSVSFNDGRDPSLLAEWVRIASDLFADGADLRDPGLSPLFADLPQEFPPVLITSGTRDLLLSHAVSLSRRLRQAGASVELRVWEEMWHVFEWYPKLPEARESLQEIAHFLASTAKD